VPDVQPRQRWRSELAAYPVRRQTGGRFEGVTGMETRLMWLLVVPDSTLRTLGELLACMAKCLMLIYIFLKKIKRVALCAR